VNSQEILHHFRHQLARRIAEREQVPQLQPLPVSTWLAASLLQKAVRRGREELALQAASTLMLNAPDRLWRRIGCIAFEDVGLADFDSVAVVTAALAGKRLRAELGGEWSIASYLVSMLARTRKDRSADDLLMNAELHPSLVPARREFARVSTRELLEVSASAAPIVERALALWFAIGTDRRPSKHLPLRHGEPQAAFDYLCEAGLPHCAVEIAREGFKKTGEVLAPFVALLSQVSRAETATVSDEFPPEQIINGVPSWTFDIYTREGRAAYGMFLRSESPSARWIRAHVAPARRVEFLGGIAFRCEGGVLRNRMRWPLGDELRRQYEIECAGPECSDASEVMELVRDDIPLLNGVRAELNGGL